MGRVPLTVHRRRDQPMFDIVNSVVYDGLMIDGTGTAAGTAFAETYPTLPPSKWIDVAGEDANGHWNPAEGQQLDRILRTLATLKFGMTEVLAIGPFKAFADQLRRRSWQGLVPLGLLLRTGEVTSAHAATSVTASHRRGEFRVLPAQFLPCRPPVR